MFSFSAAFATGAGQSKVPCTGTVVHSSDNIVSIINAGKSGQTFCIEGEHRISAPIHVRTGQTLIGTTTNSRISGAVEIGPWQATSTRGVYYYDGAYANTAPNQMETYSGSNVCYWVTTYMDDVFFRTTGTNDQRVMRVLSQNEVNPTQPITTQGQAVTAGEAGRFYFDYSANRIYLSLPNDRDPNSATVDLAIPLSGSGSNPLIAGAGQTNVTLQNLFIEKTMQYGIIAGTGWNLQNVTVRFAHGIGAYQLQGTIADPATVNETLFTENGQLGLTAGQSTNLSITNSEMSWNNIANFRQTSGQTGSGQCAGYHDAGAFHIYHLQGTATQPAVSINNLWSHNNVADGSWSDGGTQYTQITNSTFNGNERHGYYHEISCQINFSGNTLYGNGYALKNWDLPGGGLNINDSNDGTFESNLIYGNDAGFAVHLTYQTYHPDMLSNACLGAKNDTDTTNALKDNQILSNTVYTCAALASVGKAWAMGGTLNSRGNEYQSNNYHLSDSTSNWFADSNGNQFEPMAWSAWQGGEHDSEGSLSVGCEYGEMRLRPHRPRRPDIEHHTPERPDPIQFSSRLDN
ncbi:MAG TPA: hypothetical protein VF753_08040 [Terriglobales bacterium]